MERYGRKFGFTLLAMLLGGLAACAHTVTVTLPPKVDLQSQTVGIVEFTSNSTDKLNQYATQRFMSVVQGAQPQVRFLELGPEKEVLKAIGEQKMGPQAVKKIAKSYGVSAIFAGSYDVSDVKPTVSLQSLKSINAAGSVKVSMAVRQWDANTGATAWTNSRLGEWQVANFDRGAGGAISLSVSSPEEKYEQYISKLVFAISDDFRPHYEERPAPKN
jgi:hypothetical protein